MDPPCLFLIIPLRGFCEFRPFLRLGIIPAWLGFVERSLTNVLRRTVLPSVLVITTGTRFLPSTPNAVGEQAGRDFL